MKIAGALTGQWYTVEKRVTPDDPKEENDEWEMAIEGRFADPADAMAATTPLSEEGLQCRIILHRLISTELMRFS